MYLLHHLLTNSAARRPEKEAVRFEDRGVSYLQLDRTTNQVARTLRDAGVKRGDRVGIYLNKSTASVFSVFGILKAGAAYVPLDPNAPARRLAYILRDCGVKVVLTSTSKVSDLAEFLEHEVPLRKIVLLDELKFDDTVDIPEQLHLVDWGEVRACSDEPLAPTGAIDTDLAYILYTSGSTGEPKGVMVSHRTIFTFINWCCKTFGMNEADRVTSHAPLHFDLSTFDIFVTIKAGGTVVLVPDKLSIFPSKFAQLLQDEGITVTYLVPSVLSMMVNYGNLDGYNFDSLRAVLFAGEVFPIRFLRKLVKKIPHPQYFNLYGPTETNACTYYKVRASDLEPDRIQPVPIGVSCENMEVFAVNDQQELVTEPGEVGELWVRGSGVALGYWGDPIKTSKHFVQNPFQEDFEEVVYRTGDIVELDEDGDNWNFKGRRDHMVKSRGYRIELGEIEAALYAHSKVAEAAAVAIPDELLGNRIKAFVVPAETNELTSGQLADHCQNYLPHYMVPDRFEIRSALPKTSSGKIDRTSLTD